MTAPLRLVFAGTPEFAVPHLAACRRDGVEVVAVYTQPDRPAGRGRQLAQSPVKQAALAAGLAVEQPPTLKTVAARAQLARHAPDLLVVVAYGLILSPRVLALPVHGCWNVHASLLPRWRGAAPIQRAIEAGDRQTGVCLMQMDAGLDTGAVLSRRAIDIAPHDTSASLHDRLAALGADVLGEALDALAQGTPPLATAQSPDGVTYAHKLDKAQAALDWSRRAVELECQVRAFDPWPVAEGQFGGDSVRVWRAQALPTQTDAAPGRIVHAGADGIDVACGEGVLRVLELQRAGAKRLTAPDYLNGRPQWRAASPGTPV